MGLGSACHKLTWPQVQLGGDYSADLTFRGDIGRRRGGRVLGESWAKESHLWCWEDAPPE